MNDTRSEIDDEYCVLIESFLGKEVDADTFVSHYFSIWRRERKLEDDARDSWARRFDLELIEQLKSNAISEEEFSKRWATLFGLTGKRAIIEEMKGAIFTACDVYSPAPTKEFELDAEKLRNEVTAYYGKLKDAV